MKIKKQSNKRSIQIGSSSLLLIFTVLCLVVFGTLSLSSAKADHGLAIKNSKTVAAFYEADGEGEELKKEVNNTIIELASKVQDNAGLKSALKSQLKDGFDENSGMLQCRVEAGEQQFLLIELRVHDFSQITSEKENFDVVSWVVQNKEDYEIDESMDVWSGV